MDPDRGHGHSHSQHSEGGGVLDPGQAPSRWRTTGEFDHELHHLPRTSAAEFRAAAWRLWSSREPGPSNGWYFAPIGIRGFLGGLAGLVVLSAAWPLLTGRGLDGGEVALVLVCAVLSVLLIGSKVRFNRGMTRPQRRNTQLAAMSDEIDDLVRRGLIRVRPPGWEGRLPGRLEEPHRPRW